MIEGGKHLEMVNSYMCGPMKTTSMGNARYFVTFAENISRVGAHVDDKMGMLREGQGI